MYDTIAVAVNDRGAPSPLDRPCSVLLFERTASTWEAHTEIPFALSVLDSPFFVRDKVAALIAALGTCRIIAGGPVTGLAFHALDRAGFSIFEIDAVTDEMLNGIAHDVADADAQTNASYAGAIAPTPSDGDGRYFLDLIALQNEHPEVSSKQVLLPFLESTPFFQLDLVCTHLPPWLGGRTDLVVHTTPQGGTVRAVITRACEQAGTV